jgi:hypothetical protein
MSSCPAASSDVAYATQEAADRLGCYSIRGHHSTPLPTSKKILKTRQNDKIIFRVDMQTGETWVYDSITYADGDYFSGWVKVDDVTHKAVSN